MLQNEKPKGEIDLFQPKLFTTLRTYSKAQFIRDLLAGIIVAIIAIPLSIALGIASGVSPKQGLITAFVGGVVVSLLGGSRVQIAGPTGAFVVIVYGIIQKYGMAGLRTATIMAGIMLILMGIFKMGDLIKFIPYPITTGFTSGIAVVIFSTQIKDFLGLPLESVPAEFLAKWGVYFEKMGQVNVGALAIGLLSVLLLIVLPKINSKIPAALIAVIVGTLTVKIFHLEVPTIFSQFGEISGSFQIEPLSMPSFLDIQLLFMPAVAIALLGGIESLLSAVVADGMIGGNHRANTELMAQGMANILSPIFGGIPVTGAIARTSANVKLGGRTPVAGLIHGVVVLIIMLLFMPYFGAVPMAVLAGILMVVAYNMGEWEIFMHIRKFPKSDALVFFTTFFLTVIFDLVIAIEVGMVLSAFLFMFRMANLSGTWAKDLSKVHEGEALRADDLLLEEQVMYYEIEGPFFFGAADKFIKAVKEISKMPQVILLNLTDALTIDATGYYALERFYETCKRSNTQIIFIGMNEEIRKRLEKYEFIQMAGPENFVPNLSVAREKMKRD